MAWLGKKDSILRTFSPVLTAERGKNKYIKKILNLFADQIHWVCQQILFLPGELCHPRGTKQGLLRRTKKTGPAVCNFYVSFQFHSHRMLRSSFSPTRRMETAPTCSESEGMISSFCPWSFFVKTGLGMWNIIELNEPTKKIIRK